MSHAEVIPRPLGPEDFWSPLEESLAIPTERDYSVERVAEITGAYVLPGHLRNPANSVDAAIGYVLSKLAGVELSLTETPRDTARDAQRGMVESSWVTLNQQRIIMAAGEVALLDAQFNTLERAPELERLEHVLRALLYGECISQRAGGKEEIALSLATDYDHGRGILAEALAITTGTNGFSRSSDTAQGMLTMGTLPKKHTITVHGDGVYVGDGEVVGEQRPIWPPEAVYSFNLSRAEADRENGLQRAAELADKETQAALRSAEEALQAVRDAQRLLEIQSLSLQLLDEGYVWSGTVRKRGGLTTNEDLRDYYGQKYSGHDIYFLHGYAVTGRGQVTISPDTVTVYVAKPTAVDLSTSYREYQEALD